MDRQILRFYRSLKYKTFKAAVICMVLSLLFLVAATALLAAGAFKAGAILLVGLALPALLTTLISILLDIKLHHPRV